MSYHYSQQNNNYQDYNYEIPSDIKTTQSEHFITQKSEYYGNPAHSTKELHATNNFKVPYSNISQEAYSRISESPFPSQEFPPSFPIHHNSKIIDFPENNMITPTHFTYVGDPKYAEIKQNLYTIDSSPVKEKNVLDDSPIYQSQHHNYHHTSSFNVDSMQEIKIPEDQSPIPFSMPSFSNEISMNKNENYQKFFFDKPDIHSNSSFQKINEQTYSPEVSSYSQNHLEYYKLDQPPGVNIQNNKQIEINLLHTLQSCETPTLSESPAKNINYINNIDDKEQAFNGNYIQIKSEYAEISDIKKNSPYDDSADIMESPTYDNAKYKKKHPLKSQHSIIPQVGDYDELEGDENSSEVSQSSIHANDENLEEIDERNNNLEDKRPHCRARNNTVVGSFKKIKDNTRSKSKETDRRNTLNEKPDQEKKDPLTELVELKSVHHKIQNKCDFLEKNISILQNTIKELTDSNILALKVNELEIENKNLKERFDELKEKCTSSSNTIDIKLPCYRTCLLAILKDEEIDSEQFLEDKEIYELLMNSHIKSKLHDTGAKINMSLDASKEEKIHASSQNKLNCEASADLNKQPHIVQPEEHFLTPSNSSDMNSEKIPEAMQQEQQIKGFTKKNKSNFSILNNIYQKKRYQKNI